MLAAMQCKAAMQYKAVVSHFSLVHLVFSSASPLFVLQMEAVKIMAKDYVRTKNYRNKFNAMKAQLRAVGLKITVTLLSFSCQQLPLCSPLT